MKWIIWTLVIVNCGLLGFFQASHLLKEDEPEPPATASAEANKIKVLTPEQLAALPRKQPPPAPPSPACFEWGSFTPAEAAKLKTELAKLGLEVQSKPHDQDAPTRFWVYLPPLKTAAQAKAKVEELAALGVRDTLVIQETKFRNAISLGLFKEEALADAFVKKLRGLGIKNVTKLSKKRGKTEISFIINPVSAEQAARLELLKPGFSGGELNKVECRNG